MGGVFSPVDEQRSVFGSPTSRHEGGMRLREEKTTPMVRKRPTHGFSKNVAAGSQVADSILLVKAMKS